MTVIVGIYCNNGIVLAGDSALTLNGLMEQPYPHKLSIIGDRFLTGFAGDLGYAQRIDYVFKQYNVEHGLEGKDSFEIATTLSQHVINNYLLTNINTIPHNIPTSILAAFSSSSSYYLVNFPSPNFQPIFFDERNPFCSIGSGHHITNPLLSFLKGIFWPDETLTLNDGIFAAIMSLKLAIEINPGGINKPICVGILQKVSNNEFVTNLLDEDLMQEHLNNADSAVEHFQSYKAQFKNRDLSAILSVS